jgi:hypothetical protein
MWIVYLVLNNKYLRDLEFIVTQTENIEHFVNEKVLNYRRVSSGTYNELELKVVQSNLPIRICIGLVI